MEKLIQQFFNSPDFGLAGASVKKEKYGNKILMAYLNQKLKVFPIHPVIKEIEGLTTFQDVTALPASVHSLSIVTPPQITEKLVVQANKKGIKNIWMQEGAQSQTAIDYCQEHNINLIHSGPCVMLRLNNL